VFCELVRVDCASHSPQVDPIMAELGAALADLAPRAGSVPLRSTVTGEQVDGSDLDAAYWMRNLRAPVRFAEAVGTVAAEAPTVFVEISPHPVLLSSIEETLATREFAGGAVPSLVRERPERESLLRATAELYATGAPVDLRRLYPGGAAVDLPRHTWQRQSFWLRHEDSTPVVWTPEGGGARQRQTQPVDPAPAATATSAGCVVELSGSLRVLDAQARTIVALEGNLRVTQSNDAVAPEPAATAPAAVQPDAQVPAVAALELPARTEGPVLDRLIEFVAAITRMPVAQVDPARRIKDLGMDSLMATQLRKRVQAELGVSLTNRAVLDAPSLRAVADLVDAA
jgi:acyl transferase domain-containing protein